MINLFAKFLPSDQKQQIEDAVDCGLPFHRLLTLCDEVSANFFHPNDKRKLVNALFQYLKSGHPAQPSFQLRFLPIIVWIEAERSTLKQKVDARIV